MVMSGLDTLIAAVSAATSVGSVAVAVAALRRSGPRVRVSAGDFAFARAARDRIRGTARLEISFHVANTGDKPASITGAALLGLVPRPRGSLVQPAVLGSGRTLAIAVPGRARHVPLSARRPIGGLRRGPGRWQGYAEQLQLPGAGERVVNPFDGLGLTAPVSWNTAKMAHWLRIEVRLATGETLRSRWWRNRRDIIELYEAEATAAPGIADPAHAVRDRIRLLLMAVMSRM